MKKELEKLGNHIEEGADKVFNHRLHLADHEFQDLVSQVTNFNIHKLPRNMALNLHGTNLKSLEYIPGREIIKHVHNYDDDDNPKHIVYYIEKEKFEDQSFYILLLPEITEDGSRVLSVGLTKHDGNQFFTGWIDSHQGLITKRFKGFKKYVALVQFNRVEGLDTFDLLEDVKTYGAAYKFSYGETTKQPMLSLNRALSFA